MVSDAELLNVKKKRKGSIRKRRNGFIALVYSAESSCLNVGKQSTGLYKRVAAVS